MKKIFITIIVLVFIIYANSCKDCHDRGDCPQPIDTVNIKGEWVTIEENVPFNKPVDLLYIDKDADVLFVASGGYIYTWDGKYWKSFEDDFQCGYINNIERFNNKIYVIANAIKMNKKNYLNGLLVFENNQFNNFIETNDIIFSSCIHDNKFTIIGKFDSIDNVSVKNVAEYDGNNWFDVSNTSPPKSNHYYITSLNNNLYVSTTEGDLLKEQVGGWNKVYYFTDDNPFVTNMYSENNNLLIIGIYNHYGSIKKWNGDNYIDYVESSNVFYNREINNVFFDNQYLFCAINPYSDTIIVPKYNGSYWQVLKSYNESNSNKVNDICVYKGEIYIGGEFTEYFLKWKPNNK